MLVVFPDTLVQLWYIDVVGLIFLILYLGAAPYRDSWPSKVQVASLVQLEFTYITATLFFERDPDDSVGVALVLSNCVVAVLLVFAVGRSVGEISTQLGELGLTFADDGTLVTLPPTMATYDLDTHLYISHTWKHSAEQCAVIKSLLFTMLPSCTIRLADDNVSGADGKKLLEDNVNRSTAFLVFLTIEYIGSPQCLLELKAAYARRKPLIIVREAEPNYGGLSASAFRAEVALFVARKGSWLSAEEHAAIEWLLRGHAQGALEWHREKQYKYAVLTHVAEGLYHYTLNKPPDFPETTQPSKVLDDSSEQAKAPASAAEPSGKQRTSLVDRVLKGAAAPSPAPAGETDIETEIREHELSERAPAMRKMKIQDAIAMPEADIDFDNMVIYLSEHYKKLPASGFNARQQADAAAISVVVDPSEYHSSKEGGDVSPAPATLYDEVVNRFAERNIKVTSDGEAVYTADKRAIVLIVLTPELFKCAELVDEIASHLNAGAERGSSKNALLGNSTRSHLLGGVDEEPLHAWEAETKLDTFGVGASIVFGVRSAKPRASVSRPAGETHTATLTKSPLGFGMALDERNKVIDIAKDSQAARGGVRVGDVIVGLNASLLTGSASFALGEHSVGDSVDFSLRSAAAAFAEAPNPSGEPGHAFSVTLTKTPQGFGLALTADNRVEKVAPGGQAARAGIAVGDMLVAFNGTPLSTADSRPLTASQSFNPAGRIKKQATSASMSFGMSDVVRKRRALTRAASGLRWARRQKTVVPLYSTACTYDEYVRTCPPDLKELGMFSLPFEKWPEVTTASRTNCIAFAHKPLLNLCTRTFQCAHASRCLSRLPPALKSRRTRAQTAALQPVAAALALAKLGRWKKELDGRGIRGMVRKIGHGLAAVGGGAIAFTAIDHV